ncbi:unnamed protein product [Didymodactylos carnosus]|uniref:Uncharacterized protein n=1 Tax=Didymodactylos carnosus TaxID=1234261 RepID=A0A814PPY7_9BILA|nr:unnamed protein product [Didymodactylos carnosus]CAF1108963.1 unnamed protein product [Didymodactylos carnosus]CAF3730559.1 unnamed protein product [Didymodactylos carnosus]CAF3873418.1 unnamed protein product [Didymodactylos carnosus]
MNSLLSTSYSRKTKTFARSVETTDQIQSVLFEIELDTSLTTKPFASIEHLSYYKDENEILIMFGVVFKINEIRFNKTGQIWIINVSLLSDDDYQLKEIFSFYQEKISEETSLDSLGKILIEMGELHSSYLLFNC